MFFATAALALTGSTNAAATTFDFETSAPGTAVTQTVDGLTATVTAGGEAIDLTSTGYAPFGNKSLLDYFSGASPFTVNFSSLVSNVSVSAGDFGADTDTIYLAAYSGLDGTGALLGSFTSAPCCNNTDFSFSTGSATVNVTGIQSIVFESGAGDPFPQSLYFDNIVVTSGAGPVPEPATWAMMLIGMGAIGFAARRRRTVHVAYA